MGSTQEISEISSKLTSAMDVLPEMTEKKAKVDMHVDIASKILSEIKRRSIDKLQDIEDEILKGGSLSQTVKTQIQDYLKVEAGNNGSDQEMWD